MSNDGMSYDDSLSAFGHADDDAHQAIDAYYNGLINNILYNGAHAAVAALQNGNDGSGAWMGGGSNNTAMSPITGGQDGLFQNAVWNGGSSPMVPAVLNASSDMLANGEVPMGPSTNALAPGSNQPNGSYFNLFGADSSGNSPSFGLDMGGPAQPSPTSPSLTSTGQMPVGNQPDGALYQPFSSTWSNPQNQTIGGILSASPTGGAGNSSGYPNFSFGGQGGSDLFPQNGPLSAVQLEYSPSTPINFQNPGINPNGGEDSNVGNVSLLSKAGNVFHDVTGYLTSPAVTDVLRQQGMYINKAGDIVGLGGRGLAVAGAVTGQPEIALPGAAGVAVGGALNLLGNGAIVLSDALANNRNDAVKDAIGAGVGSVLPPMTDPQPLIDRTAKYYGF